MPRLHGTCAKPGRGVSCLSQHPGMSLCLGTKHKCLWDIWQGGGTGLGPSHQPCIFEKIHVYVMSKQVVFAGSPQGCKGEGWATQFAFRGAGEICPDHYNSRSPELGYLLYFCAELGTDPRVVQSPDEWPLQSPAIRIVLFPGAAGTEGTTAASPWRNPGRIGGGL